MRENEIEFHWNSKSICIDDKLSISESIPFLILELHSNFVLITIEKKGQKMATFP